MSVLFLLFLLFLLYPNDSFFKKVWAIIAILVILAIIGYMMQPRCPGCGKPWNSGGSMKYCYSCEAKRAQGKYYYP